MISTEMSNKELANDLAAYINDIEGDLEVQALLSPEKRLPQASLDCLRASLDRAKRLAKACPERDKQCRL